MQFYSRHELLERAEISRKRWKKRLWRIDLLAARPKDALKASPVTIYPPDDFNFSSNYDATVSCLEKLRTVALRPRSATRGRTVLLDFTTIRSISLAGALVLASEMDRWKRFVGRPLRPSRLHKWDPQVKQLLGHLGFFRLLDINVSVPPPSIESGNITVLPMISSESLDKALLGEMLQVLRDVALILRQDPAVYPALVEAAYNATTHAYPEGYEYRHPSVIKGWWATASWLPDKKCVKFIVFDQGVGIAETLPRWEGWEKVRGWIAEKFGSVGAFVLKDASKMIEAAISVDRTSLDGGHGKGLQDVVAVVHAVPGTQVRILSGTGSVLYHSNGQISRKDEAQHLGGTLIEWTIPVGTQQGEVES